MRACDWNGFAVLPLDVVSLIISRVDVLQDVYALRRVSRRFKRAISHLMHHPPMHFVLSLESQLTRSFEVFQRRYQQLHLAGQVVDSWPHYPVELPSLKSAVHMKSMQGCTCRCGRALMFVSHYEVSEQQIPLCLNPRCLLKRAVMGVYQMQEDCIALIVPELKGW